jgi:hypothetical protein
MRLAHGRLKIGSPSMVGSPWLKMRLSRPFPFGRWFSFIHTCIIKMPKLHIAVNVLFSAIFQDLRQQIVR